MNTYRLLEPLFNEAPTEKEWEFPDDTIEAESLEDAVKKFWQESVDRDSLLDDFSVWVKCGDEVVLYHIEPDLWIYKAVKLRNHLHP